MTISLVAVFIPVLFMGGIVGRLLHEFSVTITVAILISGFVSLTLTPMLGSRFLKHQPEDRHGRVYRTLERGFEGITHAYDVTLKGVLRHPFMTLMVALAMSRRHHLFIHGDPHWIHSGLRTRSFIQGAIALGGQDISFDSLAAHQPNRRRYSGARPQRPFHGSLRRRQQPGLHLRHAEAALRSGNSTWMK